MEEMVPLFNVTNHEGNLESDYAIWEEKIL